MATEVQLAARMRTETGSAECRRLRRSGSVPATVYGRGQDARSVSVGARDLSRALHTEAGMNVLVNLEIEGGDTELVLVREPQRHPYRDDMVHVDFLLVSRTEKVAADVPIQVTGEAKGVRESEGLLEQAMYQLTVEALPQRIPAAIEVDVTDLDVGDVLTVAELRVPEDVDVIGDPEAPVVTILTAAPVVEEVAEAAEGEEAAEGAEGGAAAAGDAGESAEG